MLRSTPHQIGSVHQCEQHKQVEAYTLNMLMRHADPIQSLSVHQSEHIILCVLSVDSFFAISVASAVNKLILYYSE